MSKTKEKNQTEENKDTGFIYLQRHRKHAVGADMER